jgi:prepilin-type N-terminal cleavage/methylation domain-containing protein/prepilin-type processing-associated H-X9-DG protein
MKTNGSFQQKAGFNLIELTVVLAAVALLGAVCLSAAATTKGQTRMVQCTANLRQFAAALQMFGAENNDKQPVNSGGIWAWDLSWSAGNSVTQYVSFKKLYCPGTAIRFTEQDNANLWNFGMPTMHVPGYLTTFPGTAIMATNINATLTPQRIVSGTTVLPAPSAAQRVLVADATISDSSTDTQAGYATGANYNFITVYGGYSVPHLSPHLNGLIPAGCNVAMLDGHVQWRKFSDMDQRATSNRGFWW